MKEIEKQIFLMDEITKRAKSSKIGMELMDEIRKNPPYFTVNNIDPKTNEIISTHQLKPNQP